MTKNALLKTYLTARFTLPGMVRPLTRPYRANIVKVKTVGYGFLILYFEPSKRKYLLHSGGIWNIPKAGPNLPRVLFFSNLRHLL